jgi:hypothetical protein
MLLLLPAARSAAAARSHVELRRVTQKKKKPKAPVAFLQKKVFRGWGVGGGQRGKKKDF